MSQQHEQPKNEPSLLLEREENEMVFTALGHRHTVSCYVILTALMCVIIHSGT